MKQRRVEWQEKEATVKQKLQDEQRRRSGQLGPGNLASMESGWRSRVAFVWRGSSGNSISIPS